MPLPQNGSITASRVVVWLRVVIDEHPDPRMLDQARKAEEAIVNLFGWTGGGPFAGASDTVPTPELTLEDLARRGNAVLGHARADAHAETRPADPMGTEHAASDAAAGGDAVARDDHA